MEQTVITVENLMVAVIRATMTAIRMADFMGADAALDTYGRVVVALGQAVEDQLGDGLSLEVEGAEAIVRAAILRAAAAEAEEVSQGGGLPCGHTQEQHDEMVREEAMADPEAFFRSILGIPEDAESVEAAYEPGPHLYL